MSEPQITDWQRSEVERVWSNAKALAIETGAPWVLLRGQFNPQALTGMSLTLCDINYYRTGKP